ncbi:unnamed protein product [Urochloa humidicola]
MAGGRAYRPPSSSARGGLHSMAAAEILHVQCTTISILLHELTGEFCSSTTLSFPLSIWPQERINPIHWDSAVACYEDLALELACRGMVEWQQHELAQRDEALTSAAGGVQGSGAAHLCGGGGARARPASGAPCGRGGRAGERAALALWRQGPVGDQLCVAYAAARDTGGSSDGLGHQQPRRSPMPPLRRTGREKWERQCSAEAMQARSARVAWRVAAAATHGVRLARSF